MRGTPLLSIRQLFNNLDQAVYKQAIRHLKEGCDVRGKDKTLELQLPKATEFHGDKRTLATTTNQARNRPSAKRKKRTTHT